MKMQWYQRVLPLLFALEACGAAAQPVMARMSPNSTNTEADGYIPGNNRSGGGSYLGEEAPPEPQAPAAAYRQAQVRRPPARTGAGTTATTTPGTPATPAQPNNPTPTEPQQRRARMLVYTATLDVVVNDVNASIEQIIATAVQFGGHLSTRNDTTVTVRVPVDRFREAMDVFERLGDVRHREVNAEDVSEQFNDLEVQLTNLRAVRRRLEEFLARAANVADALAVEQELRRVAAEIDRIEGRLRFLADQAALSTITVRITPRPTSGSLQPVNYGTPELVLPFDWLHQLGLPRLLETR